jgi:hypothetical protein
MSNTNSSEIEKQVNELASFAFKIANLASQDRQEFFNNFFYELFSTSSLMTLLEYWILEYERDDCVQSFVVLLNEIVAHAPSLQINPDSISIFRNIRLLIPLQQLLPRLLVYVATLIDTHHKFFNCVAPLDEGHCYSDPQLSFTGNLRIDILIDAAFCVFVRMCERMGLKGWEIRIRIDLLANRLAILPKFMNHTDIIYRANVAFKRIFYDLSHS